MSQNNPFFFYTEAIVQLLLVANQYRIRILVYFNSDIYLVKTILIDGFHGAFYHGNWRALHHHAAC